MPDSPVESLDGERVLEWGALFYSARLGEEKLVGKGEPLGVADLELGFFELDFLGWGGGGVGPGHVRVSLEVGDPMVDICKEEVTRVDGWHARKPPYHYQSGQRQVFLEPRHIE